jgi:hypothetical protein
MRAAESEIMNHTVSWDRYQYKMPVK